MPSRHFHRSSSLIMIERKTQLTEKIVNLYNQKKKQKMNDVTQRHQDTQLCTVSSKFIKNRTILNSGSLCWKNVKKLRYLHTSRVKYMVCIGYKMT